MFKRHRISGDRGFTLVELLVTVTIIGVLAAVVTVGVSGASSNAQVKANQGTYSDVQSAIDQWLASNPLMTFAAIPVTGGSVTATADWYSSGGVTTNADPATFAGAGVYRKIDFASTSGAATFASFLRLNAGASVFCVIRTTDAASGPVDASVRACHN
jgi:prepilin-type N-terminal cleavage/methylation domain-containing protein